MKKSDELEDDGKNSYYTYLYHRRPLPNLQIKFWFIGLGGGK